MQRLLLPQGLREWSPFRAKVFLRGAEDDGIFQRLGHQIYPYLLRSAKVEKPHAHDRSACGAFFSVPGRGDDVFLCPDEMVDSRTPVAFRVIVSVVLPVGPAHTRADPFSYR